MLGWILVAIIFMLPAHAGNAKKPALIMGVFPHMPMNRLYSLYNPAAQDIGDRIQRRVRMMSRKSFRSYRKQLLNATFDIALIQPFDYPAAARVGYLPLARRAVPLTAVFVVPRDSSITTLAQLKGKTLVNPPVRAAVTIMSQRALVSRGIKPGKDIRVIYTRNHFSCMQHILVGKADACGTARQALAHWQRFNMQKRLRVIFETRPVPHALFVVHRRVPADIRNKILQAIISWPRRPEGRAILARGPLKPFIKATDSEYDVIRRYLKHATKR
jgi:phosphonate transport system substrate-binding protein